MKTLSFLIVGLSLLCICFTGYCNGTGNNAPETIFPTDIKTPLTISNSPDLKFMTSLWVGEFAKSHSNLKINTNDFQAGQTIAGNHLNLVSDDYFPAIADKNLWKIVIGRDAVIPVINSSSPLAEIIDHRGITTNELAQILTDHDLQNWQTIIHDKTFRINLYVLNNEGIRKTITKFVHPNTISANWLATSEELIAALKNDPYAIGLCRTTDILDTATSNICEGLKILPIDKNRNGRIDYFENIYADLKSFARGIWTGKYPTALCGNIYAISSEKPTNQTTLEFLRWINSEGQKFLHQNGYGELSSAEKHANQEVLATVPGTAIQKERTLLSQTWLVTVILIIILIVSASAFISLKKQKGQDIAEDIDITPAFNQTSILAPKGIYFDKTHTWAFMEKDGTVKIGIDDFLQHITGTITRIRMKEPGEKIRRGEKILTLVQNGKQLTVYAPISGVVKEQNQVLLTDASILNLFPYTEGWVYTIEPKNYMKEIQFLFMASRYQEWIQDEFTRLKDFLTASVKSNSAVYAHVILQDGGELTDNVLADLGPEVWEDFQTSFIDISR